MTGPPDAAPAVEARQRIDKWLWHARLARTRAAAKAIAVSGHVRINREKNRAAAHLLRTGDVLTINIGGQVRVLRVRGIAERRGSAADATYLYEEIGPGLPAR